MIITKYNPGNLKGKDRSDDPSVDGRVILDFFCKDIRREDERWIQLAQNKALTVLVNTAMNLIVPYKAANFSSTQATITFSRAN
jgi:hypothetical protein